MSSPTERLYPPDQHQVNPAAKHVPTMGERMEEVAARFRAMSEAAIAESRGTPADAEATAPKEPPAVVIDWDEQLDREALVTRRRQPTDWSPVTTEVGATATQLVPSRPNRKVVLITNTGNNPALLGATVGAVANATSATFTLAAASSLSLEVEGAVWASSATGTTLAIIETYYSAQALHRAVWSLLSLAKARLGPPRETAPPSPGKATGEKGLL